MTGSINPQSETTRADAVAGSHGQDEGQGQLSTRERVRLANQSWEALFTSVNRLQRRYAATGLWSELTEHEYDVLYTISKGRGPMRISDVQSGVKLSQPGLSRMLGRLEARGLLERVSCPNDGRATLLQLTPAGQLAWRQTGRKLAREVDAAMNALSPEEQQQLRELCEKLLAGE